MSFTCHPVAEKPYPGILARLRAAVPDEDNARPRDWNHRQDPTAGEASKACVAARQARRLRGNLTRRPPAAPRPAQEIPAAVGNYAAKGRGD